MTPGTCQTLALSPPCPVAVILIDAVRHSTSGHIDLPTVLDHHSPCDEACDDHRDM
jgi:hypothetical protein